MNGISTMGASEPGGSSGTPRTYRAFALILLLVAGAGLMAGLVAWAESASAQSAQEGSKGGTPGAPGVPIVCLSWNLVPSPSHQQTSNYLKSVAAVSASNVWAVGSYFQGINSGPERTLIEHWDGSVWTALASPNVGTSGDKLEGVAAISASNVWAVGYIGSVLHAGRNLILHWDGTSWSHITTPSIGTGSWLFGVAASSANNVWAVGRYESAAYVYRTLILHWNGTSWSHVVSPNVDTSENELDGVTAISASNVWAVGSYGNSAENQARTLILHWNGTAWSVVSSPNVGTHNNELDGVTAISASNVWAVGSYGRYPDAYQTLILHWNGTAWSVVSSPNPSTVENHLYEIAAVSSNDVWAVGWYQDGQYGPDVTLILHWNGTAWSHVASPNRNSSGQLYGVAVVSASNIWAVGYYQFNSNNSSYDATLVERYYCPPPPTNTPIPTNTPVPFPTQCAIQFEDVPNPSTFYPYTQCLACRGIVGGFACGGTGEPCDPNNDPYFRPHNDVSRGQLAKIVARSAQINIPVSGQTFEDVPPGSAFYTYTEELHSLGVMGGYTCGGTNEPCVPPANRPYFRPHNSATRGQLAKIDANTAGYNDIPTLQVFEDVAPGSTYYTYTYRLVDRSIMTGYACGGSNEPCVPPLDRPYFRPTNNVTRGQSSKIVANTFYPNCQAPPR